MAHGTVTGRASGGCMHEELVMAEGILCTMDDELSTHGRPMCGFFSQQTLA